MVASQFTAEIQLTDRAEYWC